MRLVERCGYGGEFCLLHALIKKESSIGGLRPDDRKHRIGAKGDGSKVDLFGGRTNKDVPVRKEFSSFQKTRGSIFKNTFSNPPSLLLFFSSSREDSVYGPSQTYLLL